MEDVEAVLRAVPADDLGRVERPPCKLVNACPAAGERRVLLAARRREAAPVADMLAGQ